MPCLTTAATQPAPRHGSNAALGWVLGTLLCMLAQPLLAQSVYRSVGADGRVTFSDQPPTGPQATVVAPGAAPAPGNELPFALSSVVNRNPVVLYTTQDCAPCNSGRQLLEARGIPFTEKTVNNAQSVEALKRLSGGESMPWLTLGQRSVRGFSTGEWNRSLDAAGYPAKSMLPAQYRRPAPVALAEPAVAQDTPSTTRRSTSTPADQSSPSSRGVPVAPPPSAGGIRF